ncbi:glycosyltransferase [bacterium]|nr:glycosyltransferase [bacterium]
MNPGNRGKIHFIHLTSAPGGLEVLLPLIIRALPAYDFRAFIIRPPSVHMPDVYEGTEVNRQYGSLNNAVAAARLFRYVRKNRRDLFHVYNTGPLFLMVLRIAGAKRVVYSIHGTRYWKSAAQKLIMRAAWRFAMPERFVVTANSDYSRTVFLTTVLRPVNGIEIIYNPVDIEAGASAAVKREAGLLTIGYAGRLVPGKNLIGWLNVAQKLSREFGNLRFVIYGDGVLREELIKHAGVLGILDIVSFRGFVRDVASAYSECDVMLFLSGRESFGNAVVESVLCGTPVIASDIPAFREILANWSYCIVPADETAAGQIADRLKNLDILRGYLPGMITEFRARFSRDQHISKISRIYETVSS